MLILLLVLVAICESQGEERGGGCQAEGAGHASEAAPGSTTPQNPHAQKDDHQKGKIRGQAQEAPQTLRRNAKGTQGGAGTKESGED